MRRVAILTILLFAFFSAAPAKNRFATDVTVGAAIAGGVDSLLNIKVTLGKMRAAAGGTKKAVKKVAAKVAGK